MIDYADDAGKKSDYNLFTGKLQQHLSKGRSFKQIKQSLFSGRAGLQVDDCSIINIYKTDMININKEQNGYILAAVDVTEANLNNADQFKAELVKLLDTQSNKIVVDLSSVSYMDSSFLGALVSGLKHAISLKSDVLLVGLKKDIYDLFTLIRLDKVFKIYNSFEDVLTAG
jgi:anti-sigma B factor antagonist